MGDGMLFFRRFVRWFFPPRFSIFELDQTPKIGSLDREDAALSTSRLVGRSSLPIAFDRRKLRAICIFIQNTSSKISTMEPRHWSIGNGFSHAVAHNRREQVCA